MKKKLVWFHRSRSMAWMLVAILAFPLHWLESVVFVSFASLYANITSDWANSEAADNSELIAEIRELRTLVEKLLDK